MTTELYAAIPTTYKGVRMRSRLEAKWAAMFDQMKWSWEYEPIDLDGWIPDFLVKIQEGDPGPPINNRVRFNLHKPMLIEIKPIFNVEKNIVDDYRPPKEVTNKIEKSLHAPANWLGGDGNWEKFFKDLPYIPMLLGTSPNWIWEFGLRNGWDYIGTEIEYGDGVIGRHSVRCPCWYGNSEKFWREAGNQTQWKKPS